VARLGKERLAIIALLLRAPWHQIADKARIARTGWTHTLQWAPLNIGVAARIGRAPLKTLEALSR